MKVLYASERPPYPLFLGGAARCAHQLLLGMARDQHITCCAVGSSDYSVTSWSFPAEEEAPTLGVRSMQVSAQGGSQGDSQGGSLDCGYPVHIIDNYNTQLEGFIDNFQPDIIWSQLDGGEEIMALAARKGIQGLYYVHDAEFDPEELRRIARTGCHLVASSRFLAGLAERACGRQVQVIYPASGLYFDTQADPAGFITMINPVGVKGIDTLLSIAAELPEERFLLVESWKLGDKALQQLHTQLASLPNVRFQTRVADMREIYRQTRLLLAPSLWEEGFGMVAIEAQSCRIPVIASARGGLVESVGDGGLLIKDYLNVERWLEAIRGVLGDQNSYASLSERAYQHAVSAQFSPAHLATQFANICASEAPRAAPISTRIVQNIRRTLHKAPVLHRLLK